TPPGSTSWFQGDSGNFVAHSGGPASYIAANFNNAGAGGTISDWLMTPVISLDQGGTLQFYTRTTTDNQGFPDRLKVRLTTNAASDTLADFSTLLLTINDILDPAGYPTDWAQYSVALPTLAGASGRVAFVYDIDNTDQQGNYVGLDSVSINAGSLTVPEPE